MGMDIAPKTKPSCSSCTLALHSCSACSCLHRGHRYLSGIGSSHKYPSTPSISCTLHICSASGCPKYPKHSLHSCSACSYTPIAGIRVSHKYPSVSSIRAQLFCLFLLVPPPRTQPYSVPEPAHCRKEMGFCVCYVNILFRLLT